MSPLVYVIDNDQAMIESLSWLIESAKIRIKTYKCTQTFLEEYDKNQHSCAIVEARMAGLNGLELQQKINQQGGHLPIIYVSCYADVSLAVQSMKLGAVDFLIKPFNDRTLLESINKALDIDKKNRDKQVENGKYKECVSSLSQREKQILQGILASEQNKVISTKLNISLKTVEAHRASMMKKMNVSSVVELIKLVVTNGLH